MLLYARRFASVTTVSSQRAVSSAKLLAAALGLSRLRSGWYLSFAPLMALSSYQCNALEARKESTHFMTASCDAVGSMPSIL